MSELIERLEKYLYERSVSRGLCRNIHMMNGAELNEEDLREAITALQDKDKRIAELRDGVMEAEWFVRGRVPKGSHSGTVKSLADRLLILCEVPARQAIKDKE